jgi:hypothetical protein
MNSEQLQILLTATQKTARDHFGVELRFTQITEVPIETLFNKIPEADRMEAAKHIYDFKSGKGDPEYLAQEFGKGLRQMGEPLAAMVEYARPYLGDLKENSYESLGAAMAKLQLSRVELWKTVPAHDGGFAIDASSYNESQMWIALGYGDVPYDLVLTNQVIASVEDVYPAVHAAIRGGYANGITTYSKQSRYGTYAVWSTFAFNSNESWVRQIREGESYSPEDAARLAGIGAAHELGHQLFHFSHPFANSACIMNPVPMFNYLAWSSKLSPKDCLIGSSPAMLPGASKFGF